MTAAQPLLPVGIIAQLLGCLDAGQDILAKEAQLVLDETGSQPGAVEALNMPYDDELRDEDPDRTHQGQSKVVIKAVKEGPKGLAGRQDPADQEDCENHQDG